jgi:hypothetical protein
MVCTARLVVFALIAPLAAATAQKTLVSLSGTVMRYHGDTIWMERDSTMQESITRGDTVETISAMNGVERRRSVYVIRGDSAYVIRNGTVALRGLPSSVATSLNTMLALELRSQNTLRMLESPPLRGQTAPPASPETTATYKISPALRISQHRDTLTYVRGCEGAHNDTTLFLLFGRDSVKRISQPQRMFGQAMANGLYSQMRMSLMQEFTNAFQGPLPPDMPKAPGGCPH